MKGQTKKAKVLKDGQIGQALAWVAANSRYPERDAVMILLSARAGLRAKEVAMATWSMVTDATGDVADTLCLTNDASKGKAGGREVPLNRDLRAALVALKAKRSPEPGDRIVHSERDAGMSPGAVTVWFHRLYNDRLGFSGASSHSGRRTFVTNTAKAAIAAGGTLRDVQEMVGHASLQTTQGYIQGSTDAKRRMVGA